MTESRSIPVNWVESRIARTSDALDRAFDEGLTGHVFTWRDGKQVRLKDGTEAIEFVSCSYLGLEVHPDLVNAAIAALTSFGLHFSSSRNRMRPPYLAELEEILSSVYTGANVVCFTSVSNVHLGILPLLGSGALPSYPINQSGVTFLIEKTAHASMQILRGVLEQIGLVQRFDLLEPDSLQNALYETTSTKRTPIVLVDGVGSMNGLVDVAGIYKLIQQFNGHLYIDDAHGISIDGPYGAGYAFAALGNQLPSGVLIAGSLSKGFGGSGGFAVLPGEADERVLRKFANPLVFGHSIMLPMLAANVAAARLHINGEVVDWQTRLWDNVAYFDDLTGQQLINAGLRSPIRGALFTSEKKAFDAALRLRAVGVLVLPAFFPTVAAGHGLLRFALSALHQRDQIELAAHTLDISHS